MKQIKVLRANSGGIQIKFMHEKVVYNFAPVKNGQFDNSNDYAAASVIAHQISADLFTGKFDNTLNKYKPASDKELIAIETRLRMDWNELWSEYTKTRKNQVAPATFQKTYGAVFAVLKICPYKSIQEASKLQAWISQNKPPITARRLIMQLNAACKWGVRHKLIDKNPLENALKDLNKKAIVEHQDIDPFTEQERDLIIDAFCNHPKWSHYRYFVAFLFATGCRSSEAIPLTWDDCKFKLIDFNKVFVYGKINNRLKTQSKRVIKQNNKVQDILANQKSYLQQKNQLKSELVFPSIKANSYIDWSGFSEKVWKKVLNDIDGLKYKNPYQMRHTFITLALKNVDIRNIAKHCGNSPEIILKHYAGNTRDFVMPEI